MACYPKYVARPHHHHNHNHNHNLIIIIIINVFVLYFMSWRTYYLNADSVYIIFVRYNLKVLHCHVFNCWLVNGTWFHTSVAIGSLVIRLKANENVAQLPFGFICSRYFFLKSSFFFWRSVTRHISVLYAKWQWCWSHPTIHAPTILLLLIIRSLKAWSWCGLQSHNTHTRFCENHSVKKLKWVCTNTTAYVV
jgi:hypothetical protein